MPADAPGVTAPLAAATAALTDGNLVTTPPSPIGPITGPTPATTTPPPPPPPGSAWSAPTLVNPITVTLSAGATSLALPQNRDYILKCPSAPFVLTSTLSIWGGHNVVFENCDEYLSVRGWAARFKNQTGTMWIHDVHFGGSYLTGGIQLQEPAATLVMRDVLFDKVNGSQSTNHAELIQTWSGPDRLLIDGLTGATGYQGLFLLPNQYGGAAPRAFDLRNINIDDTTGAYALWLGDVSGSSATNASSAIATWNVQNVYVKPNPSRTWPGWWLWPKPSSGDPTWSKGVSAGVPPGGNYTCASATGATGVDEGVAPTPLPNEGP